MEQDIEELKKQLKCFQEYKEKYEEIKQEKDILQNENDKLRKEKLSVFNSNIHIKTQHSATFWIDIIDKINKDPGYIKYLIKNKKMSLNDVNGDGRTLLTLCALKGSYEMVQFCLNAGSDIHHIDNGGESALDHAKSNGYYHVEQLLLFSEMNVTIGNKIKNTSNIMNKQKGINENIFQQLKQIGEQTKQIFESTIIELIINLIQKKLSFDDVLLNLCWDIVCNNNLDPLSSDLWKTLASTSKNIIESGCKRDWYWFKTFVVPSTIWLRNIHIAEKEEKKYNEIETKQNETHYLYFELLKLVEDEAKVQLNELDKNLNKLATKNKNDWKELICWEISTSTQYKIVRQDCIPNGIESQYTRSQLLEKSGTTFNAHQFYDHNQYLSELILLAQIVDDDFQNSVQQIFNININEDQKMDDNINNISIKYKKGPVKLIERARAKAENDYSDQLYPTSACVLDLNRCSLFFKDIHSLLTALQLFVNKIKYFQSGSIIGIVRSKNGFQEYIKQTQYADIKFNVLIKGRKNNIIGEVQFLFEIMKDYKDKAHNLYSIQRQREYIQHSVSKILPMLLDEEKQLFIRGDMNDVVGLYRLMIINNFTNKDLIKQNKENQTILLHACELGNNKVFLFLQSILSKDLFLKYLFLSAIYDDKPIEMAIMESNAFIVQNVFKMKKVQEKYNNDDNELFRLFFWLFAFNKSNDIIDFVLSILNVSNQKVSSMMNYKYPKPLKPYPKGAAIYHQYKIICEVVRWNKLNGLKKLISIIGEQTFIHAVFVNDGYDRNALDYAIMKNKLYIMKYMLSIKDIKDKCINHQEILLQLISTLNKNYNESMVLCIINSLQLNEKKLKELQAYQKIEITKILNLCK